MSDKVTPLHQRGLSLRYAYTPRNQAEQQAISNQHPCAACGKLKNYVVGDSGPKRLLEGIAYYRVALKCRCGFMNFAYVIVNDLPEEQAGQAQPSTETVLRSAEASGDLPDSYVEELLVRMSAAGFNEEWEKSMDLARQCIDRAPHNPAAWFNLGWLHIAAGDYQAGLAAYRQTIELSNDFPSAWLNMGNVYHHLEQYEDALACLGRFLEQYPNHAEAKQRRDECLQKMNATLEG
jgi:tetratricopeptide (TPR) repeat protein